MEGGVIEFEGLRDVIFECPFVVGGGIFKWFGERKIYWEYSIIYLQENLEKLFLV